MVIIAWYDELTNRLNMVESGSLLMQELLDLKILYIFKVPGKKNDTSFHY